MRGGIRRHARRHRLGEPHARTVSCHRRTDRRGTGEADDRRVVAARMPGGAPRASAPHARPLGLRRPGSNGPAGRPRGRRARSRRRVSSPSRRAFPYSPDDPRRRLRCQRLQVDRGRQHFGVQLPVRRRDEPLVRARLRARDRREPDREPLRLGRAHVTSREPPVRRTNSSAARYGLRGRRARPRVRRDRVGMGRPLDVGQGLPALLGQRPLIYALAGVLFRSRYDQIAPPRIAPANGPTM
jgi:hypothetical protein